MNFHDRAVQRYGLDLDAHDLVLLQTGKDPIEHAALSPAVHARIDRVPVAEAFGQATPFAALFGHVQDRIKHVTIAQADMPRCTGKQCAIRSNWVSVSSMA